MASANDTGLIGDRLQHWQRDLEPTYGLDDLGIAARSIYLAQPYIAASLTA